MTTPPPEQPTEAVKGLAARVERALNALGERVRSDLPAVIKQVETLPIDGGLQPYISLLASPSAQDIGLCVAIRCLPPHCKITADVVQQDGNVMSEMPEIAFDLGSPEAFERALRSLESYVMAQAIPIKAALEAEIVQPSGSTLALPYPLLPLRSQRIMGA